MNLATTFRSFEVSVVQAAVADTLPIVQVFPSQVSGIGTSVGLLRLSVTLMTAVATRVGLIKPTAPGTPNVFTSPYLVSAENVSFSSSGVSMARAATGWAVNPTFSGTPVYARQELLPAIVGASFEWTWPDDDPYQAALQDIAFIAGGQGAVLRNLTGAASAQLLISMRWRDFAPKA